MRVAGYIALCAAVLFTTSASAQQQPAFFTSVLWVLKPVAMTPIEGEPETRTAQVGSFLFEQDMAGAVEGVLQSRIEIAIPGATRWNRSPGNVVFEAGDALVLVGGVGGRAAFCDRRISFEAQNVLDGRKIRACLVDDNRDGVLDRVMWGGALENTFAPMMLTGWQTAAPLNVAYTPRLEGNPPLIRTGPVVTRSPLGAYRVTFAVDSRGTPYPLADLNHTGGEMRPDASGNSFDASGLYFRSGDTPVRVDVMGARIEIVSVDGSTVTYRVFSNFDPATPMQIGYGGTMGRAVAAAPPAAEPASTQEEAPAPAN